MKLAISLLISLCAWGLSGKLVRAFQTAPRLPLDSGSRAVSNVGERLLAMNVPWLVRYHQRLAPILEEVPLPYGLDRGSFIAWHGLAGWPLWVLAAYAFPEWALQLLPLCLGIGMAAPYFWLKQRQKSFHTELLKSLPECLDLNALVLEAGLDLSTGLKEYLEKGPAGPLRTLLERVRTDMQLGQSRLDAFRALSKRTTYPPLRDVCRTLVQGLTLGTSLAPLLRAQAAALRTRRMQVAEKKAAEAPVKVLFPLFVFIFPTLFLVLLGPIALMLVKGGF